MKAKSPKISATTKTEIVCPNDTNPMGILQGSRLLKWMDIAGAICAQTHTGTICVTAAVYKADFKNTAQVGNIISIHATITRTFNTSMEVFVKAYACSVLEGQPYLISEAYFCFVALDHIAKKRR